jgi:bacterial/archaeal transporter family-2 protein
VEKVGLATIATIAAGGLIALQPPLVARLADATGTLPAAALNFIVGSACLVVLALIVGDAAGFARSSDVSWYYVIGGGVVGAIYVTTVILAVGSLGAAGVVAATIAGQLTISVVIDRLGILGLEQTPIAWERLLGVALLLAGTYLVVR